MPVSVILAFDDATKARALAEGFREQTVLVRHESMHSDDKATKDRVTSKVLRELKPFQYLLSEYWGMGPGPGD